MPESPASQEKRAFISYVHENGVQIDKLCKILDRAGIPYWRDRKELGPGDKWKAKIRQAIESGSMVFLACFSEHYGNKESSHMNEELNLAVAEYRRRRPDRTWLIPVRLDNCEIPDYELGAGQTIKSELQYVDLFGEDYAENAVTLVRAIEDVMGASRGVDAKTVRTAADEVSDAERPAMLQRLTEEMIHDPSKVIPLDALIAQEQLRVLEAMRDPERFPTSLSRALNEDERVLVVAKQADDYWHLIEPFCWSLQVAARWAPNANALRPWATAMIAFAAEARKQTGGTDLLLDLRDIPTLATVFVAAFASSAQPRWDNFKTLLVDNTVPASRRHQQAISILGSVNPYDPFLQDQAVPSTLAQSAIHKQDLESALAAVRAGGGLVQPAAQWLHAILREAFIRQLPNADTYDEQFDRAEVIAGIVSADEALVQSKNNPELGWLFRSKWFGRSAPRAYNGYGPNPVEEFIATLETQHSRCAPIEAGLFGGSFDRAVAAATNYHQDFAKAGNQFW